MGCSCKNTKKISQPKQVNKSTSKSAPKTAQKSAVTKRIIRRRPI